MSAPGQIGSLSQVTRLRHTNVSMYIPIASNLTQTEMSKNILKKHQKNPSNLIKCLS